MLQDTDVQSCKIIQQGKPPKLKNSTIAFNLHWSFPVAYNEIINKTADRSHVFALARSLSISQFHERAQNVRVRHQSEA